MEDWATSDYTRTYGDTVFVPEPGYDSGVYLLEESGQENPAAGYPQRTGVGYGHRPGRYGETARGHPGPAGPVRSRGVKEGYYTGGNVISQSGYDRQELYNTAWDERPERYNPNSGADWARLVPNPRDRPYGGGPAPSLAFPMISQSEAMNKPDDAVFPSAASSECGTKGCGRPHAVRENFAGLPSARAVVTVDALLQVFKVILLFVVVILLAMALVSSNRIERDLEKLTREVALMMKGS